MLTSHRHSTYNLHTQALDLTHRSSTINRRSLLANTLSTACVACAGLAPIAAPARAATSHRQMLGDIEITVLSDGHLVIPVSFLAVNAGRMQLDAALTAAGYVGDLAEPPTNVTLLRTGTDVILVDTGAGPHFMPTAGKLLANMDAAGVDPASVTKVVFTHAHPDHIWGTLDDFDAAPNFPNASYVIAAAEWAFWMADDVATKLPADRQSFGPGAQRNLKRIKDKVRLVKPGEDIAPGLRALDTSGHTAGHIAIEVISGNAGMLIIGDALSHAAISFAHPEWKPAADHHDADQAVATRKRLLDRLAADRTPIIGYHLPFPGIGRVERAGTAYRYVAGA
jgi:glyoxylase-like metal-dependent hydrolase (beta-lactamase superfamily II)